MEFVRYYFQHVWFIIRHTFNYEDCSGREDMQVLLFFMLLTGSFLPVIPALLLPTLLALMVRRLHDLEWSGYWVLLCIPLWPIALPYLSFAKGDYSFEWDWEDRGDCWDK